MRLSRLFLWAMAATVALTIVVSIASLFLAGLMSFRLPGFEVVAGCGLLVMAYLIVGLGCAVVLENGRVPRAMHSGILVGAAALLGWIGAIVWSRNATEMLWNKVLVWPTVWACLMMFVGLLMLPKIEGRWIISLRRITIFLLVLFGAHICLAYLFYPEIHYSSSQQNWQEQYARTGAYEDTAFRIGVSLALLTAGSLVFMLLAVWIPRFTGQVQRPRQGKPYWVRCPRCAEEQTLATGVSNCRRCGLRIKVELT